MGQKRKYQSRDDYEVGKGKPPEEHQFKPGESGNPAGRPKAAKNMRTILDRLLSESMPVKGEVKKVSKREAVLLRLYADAMNGKPAAMARLLDLITKTGGFDEPPAPEKSVGEDDAALLRAMLERRRRQKPE